MSHHLPKYFPTNTKYIKIAYMKIQEGDEPTTCECVGKMFNERELDVLLVAEAKLKRKEESLNLVR